MNKSNERISKWVQEQKEKYSANINKMSEPCLIIVDLLKSYALRQANGLFISDITTEKAFCFLREHGAAKEINKGIWKIALDKPKVGYMGNVSGPGCDPDVE